MDVNEISKFATILADETDTDYILYNGTIAKPFDNKIIDGCNGSKRRKNVVLILCSLGGDPNAGYRMARCLQQKYTKFVVLIDGPCKSAATMIAIGAHEVIMSDYGELGPLDIQIGKKDELWETDSGLTVLTAIKALEEKSFELFESCFLNLKGRSGGKITLKTATEMASKLAIGTIAPIVAQIDPLHVGEVSRAMNIGMEYGRRLAKTSKNTKDTLEDTLQRLSNDYPSHGFVIDREEAKDIFNIIREPTVREEHLLNLLSYLSKVPNRDQVFHVYLSNQKAEEKNEDHYEQDHSEGTEHSGESISATEGFCGEQESESKDGEVLPITKKRKTRS